jgi:hypothetical protein
VLLQGRSREQGRAFSKAAGGCPPEMDADYPRARRADEIGYGRKEAGRFLLRLDKAGVAAKRVADAGGISDRARPKSAWESV